MRTIVITGSASGIGKATAAKLTAQGDRVIGVDLRNADVNVDLTTDIGRAQMVAQVEKLSGGKIDAVIANAGLAEPIPATIAVNVFGAMATLEGLRPMLLASPAPRAVLTSSMATLTPYDDELVKYCLDGNEGAALERAAHLVEVGEEHTIYSSSKVAVTRWMRSVAATAEWAGAGIALNAIGPGIVETAMTADMIATPEARDGLLQQVPMPLNGVMPAEAPADLLVWLISVANTHLCGQLIFIDGGSDVVMRGPEAW